jgi:putative hydrolase of the HAD superfamily
MALVDAFDGIIFDYGGVLVGDQTPDDVARMAAASGLTEKQLGTLYWDNRLAYDRGDVSGSEYWQDIARRGQAGPLTDAQVAQLIEIDNASWMRFDPEMWTWIDKLRVDGKRLAILSNMPKELGETLKTRTDRFAPFTHVTLSYEVRSAKPEPAIYQHCLEGIGTDISRTLFLDDRAENIAGAQALGLEGIQFTSRTEVLPRLLS